MSIFGVDSGSPAADQSYGAAYMQYLKDNGVNPSYWLRYLCLSPNFSEQLESIEIDYLHNVKQNPWNTRIPVGFIWNKGSDSDYFQTASGEIDAESAIQRMEELKVPCSDPGYAVFIDIEGGWMSKQASNIQQYCHDFSYRLSQSSCYMAGLYTSYDDFYTYANIYENIFSYQPIYIAHYGQSYGQMPDPAGTLIPKVCQYDANKNYHGKYYYGYYQVDYNFVNDNNFILDCMW